MQVLIHGSGRLGRQVLQVLRSHFADRYQPVGFIDDIRPAGDDVLGLPVLGTLEDVATAPGTSPDQAWLVPAIGYRDQPARGRALDRACALGYRLPTLVHPRAGVEPTATLGDGVIVLAGVLVDQGVVVGDGCYLDQGVMVGEDSVLQPNSYLAAGTIVAGGVRLGRDCFLGAGSVVTDGVNIGDACIVNAQSLVHRDLPAHHKLVQTRQELRLPLPDQTPESTEVDHGQA